MKMESIRGREVEAQLARALLAAAERAGVTVSPAVSRSRPWASATFVGTLHAVTLACTPCCVLGRWLADLPLAELPMRGHIVASLAVDRIVDDGTLVTAELSVLTLEDC